MHVAFAFKHFRSKKTNMEKDIHLHTWQLAPAFEKLHIYKSLIMWFSVGHEGNEVKGMKLR